MFRILLLAGVCSAQWTYCAPERQQCLLNGTQTIRYSADTRWFSKTFSASSMQILGFLCSSTLKIESTLNLARCSLRPIAVSLPSMHYIRTITVLVISGLFLSAWLGLLSAHAHVSPTCARITRPQWHRTVLLTFLMLQFSEVTAQPLGICGFVNGDPAGCWCANASGQHVCIVGYGSQTLALAILGSVNGAVFVSIGNVYGCVSNGYANLGGCVTVKGFCNPVKNMTAPCCIIGGCPSCDTLSSNCTISTPTTTATTMTTTTTTTTTASTTLSTLSTSSTTGTLLTNSSSSLPSSTLPHDLSTTQTLVEERTSTMLSFGAWIGVLIGTLVCGLLIGIAIASYVCLRKRSTTETNLDEFHSVKNDDSSSLHSQYSAIPPKPDDLYLNANFANINELNNEMTQAMGNERIATPCVIK